MAQLRKRTFLFTAAQRKADPLKRAFLAPQREHIKQPMPKRAAS